MLLDKVLVNYVSVSSGSMTSISTALMGSNSSSASSSVSSSLGIASDVTVSYTHLTLPTKRIV